MAQVTREIGETLKAIQAKDPRIYDDDVKFYGTLVACLRASTSSDGCCR